MAKRIRVLREEHPLDPRAEELARHGNSYGRKPRNAKDSLHEQFDHLVQEERQVGRPSSYRREYDEIVTALHLSGASIRAICMLLRISPFTYQKWAEDHSTFASAIMKGREIADAMVAQSLFHRAVGYSHDAVHISVSRSKEGDVDVIETPYVKHYPPDTQAGVYWLNNRSRGKWKSSTSLEHITPDDTPVDPTKPPRITVTGVPPNAREDGE